MPGNCGERLIGASLILEIVTANGDDMLHPLPFPNQARPGDRQALASPLGPLAGFAAVLLSEYPKPLDGLLFQAAVSQLLNAVGQPALQKAPVIGRRLRVEQCAPFGLQGGRRCAL